MSHLTSPAPPDTTPAGLARAKARVAREAAALVNAATIGVPDPHPSARDPMLRGPDLGPAHQRRSRRLEAVDAVDPAHPKGARIRRARLRDPLRRMVRTGAIPYRLYFGAEEFREDLEKSEGGRDQAEVLARALSRLATGTPPPPPRHPWTHSNEGAPGQWSAQQRVQRAWQQAIGLVAGGVFHWVVISRGTLADYTTTKRMRKGAAAATLKAALERLADFYGVGDVQPPPEWEAEEGA
jgi:hypothetical protein